MIIKSWNDLPDFMRISEVKPYYDVLKQHKLYLVLKRCFDIVASIILLVIFAIPMLIIAIGIKIDSQGPVFYRQERVTLYGKKFRIHKFRTMVDNADKKGSTVTISDDCRITRIGKKIRGTRLDELPQLFDVIVGNMTFVGTRPEAVKYVEMYGKYDGAYYATLLLPAGITSETSIRFKNEAELLGTGDNIDEKYMNDVLPKKMVCNLNSIQNFSFISELLTMARTVIAVLR